jgi:N-acetylmuramoyl-L-alanine amidase
MPPVLSPSPSRSPNHGPRPDGIPVDILLVHYTGMPGGAAALERLCDPAVQVSAHYLVDEDGTVVALVPEDRRAWHAGAGFWQGERDINSRSVGVELVNPGHEWGYRPFPDAQMAAFAELARGILDRHGILPHRVLGHSDVLRRRPGAQGRPR